jgi:two-component system, chemotaxis family, CheB/CheR fusion protein
VSGLQNDADLEGLLSYVRVTRGFDFATVEPQRLNDGIRERMVRVGIEGIQDYRDHLEANPGEFVDLFDAILGRAEAFFDPPDAWRYLADQIVPRILDSKDAGEPIRLWSAGCGSGEEPYSLAMIFANALGLAEYAGRVKIYATDADEAALADARRAEYSAAALANVPREQIDRWFQGNGDRATLVPQIRRAVVLGRHDLKQDPPMTGVDLVACRNVLIYFPRDTQERTLVRLHTALNDGGFIFLGRSEIVFSAERLFAPVSTVHRVLSKASAQASVASSARVREQTSIDRARATLDEHAMDSAPAAQIVVDPNGIVALLNEEARRVFGLDHHDLGRALRDLEVSYRPVDLRSAIDEVREKGIYRLEGVEKILADGSTQFLDLTVAPVKDDSGSELGMIITFADVTDQVAMRGELENARRDLEAAYEDLHATNEEVQTMNEELQSTVEELDTTNQELQATNEELETMNEELQSTNEELRAVNDELRERTDDLNQSTLFTDAIFGSLAVAILAVDHEMVIRLWTSRAAETFGMRADEVVGTPFLSLDCGIPVRQIEGVLRASIEQVEAPEPMLLDMVDRVGRAVRTRIRCVPTQVPGGMKGAVLVVEILD